MPLLHLQLQEREFLLLFTRLFLSLTVLLQKEKIVAIINVQHLLKVNNEEPFRKKSLIKIRRKIKEKRMLVNSFHKRDNSKFHMQFQTCQFVA